MAEANAEGRDAAVDQLARRLDRVVARLGVAGAVGQEDAVGLVLERLRRRRLRRHHRHLAAAARQHAQDVLLDAEVVRHHMVLARGLRAVARAERPLGLGPFVRRDFADDFGEVEPRHARCRPCLRDRIIDVLRGDRRACGQGDDAPVLRAGRSQHASQAARVDVRDRHGAFALQVLRQGHRAAKARLENRQVLDDQAGRVNLARLDVFGVDPVVADVRIRQRDDLPAVARVGENFLVAGQRGVEHHFAGGLAGGTDRCAFENGAVCECEESGRQNGQQGELHFRAQLCLATGVSRARIRWGNCRRFRWSDVCG